MIASLIESHISDCFEDNSIVAFDDVYVVTSAVATVVLYQFIMINSCRPKWISRFKILIVIQKIY